eukprot:scaffold101094_cov32-Phaeocystis_antarctica.AAC.2
MKLTLPFITCVRGSGLGSGLGLGLGSGLGPGLDRAPRGPAPQAAGRRAASWACLRVGRTLRLDTLDIQPVGLEDAWWRVGVKGREAAVRVHRAARDGGRGRAAARVHARDLDLHHHVLTGQRAAPG